LERKNFISELISELKRRGVLPVAGAYLVAAWVLVQVTDVIVPAFALPNYVITAVLIIMIVGFPVAITLAWVFDITTDGIKRTLSEWHETSDPEASSNPPLSSAALSSAPSGSVVVLPFMNIGGNIDNEYFSDGLTEDIIDALAKTPYLQVVARTSSFVFKNKNEDIRDIGARLNVAYVVEGSVRKADDRMRIVAQLIGVRDGYHVWSETFDRKLIDVFETLDEIAQAIASHITELLSDNNDTAKGTQSHRITRHTNNLDAYHLYLKGRYFWNQRGEGITKGMEYFQQAAAADSRYALPYVGLADTYALLGYYGYMPPKLAFPLANENATRALNLDASLAEAHTSRALVKMYFDWDWEGARTEFFKAIELDARYPPAQYWLSVLYTILREPEKAAQQDKIALKVDPVSAFVNLHHGWTLLCTERYEESIAQLLKTLELDHSLWSIYELLIYAYSEAGRYEDAIAVGQVIREGTGNRAFHLPAIGYAHAKAGEADKARAVIAELESLEGEFFWPSHVACIYGALEEFDLAFEWLEKAFSIKDHWLVTMDVQPGFKTLHQHPSYKGFASRVGIGDLKN